MYTFSYHFLFRSTVIIVQRWGRGAENCGYDKVFIQVTQIRPLCNYSLYLPFWVIGKRLSEKGWCKDGNEVPEEIIKKDHHLRPRRLRRSSAAGKSMSSGEHSLVGSELVGITTFSGKGFPPVWGCPTGGQLQKHHHLRPRRLRRTTAARNATSSGEQLLAGVEVPGTITTSDER